MAIVELTTRCHLLFMCTGDDRRHLNELITSIEKDVASDMGKANAYLISLSHVFKTERAQDVGTIVRSRHWRNKVGKVRYHVDVSAERLPHL